jgi:hypothetical protein
MFVWMVQDDDKCLQSVPCGVWVGVELFAESQNAKCNIRESASLKFGTRHASIKCAKQVSQAVSKNRSD